MTGDVKLQARLRAAGWSFEGGMWRLQTRRTVFRVSNPEAAEVIQNRRDAARAAAARPHKDRP